MIEAQQKKAAIAIALFSTDTLSFLIDVLIPRNAELTKVLTSVVQEIVGHDHLTSSQKVMDPKNQEWTLFYNDLYTSDHCRHIIHSDKYYCYMCYQSLGERQRKGFVEEIYI